MGIVIVMGVMIVIHGMIVVGVVIVMLGMIVLFVLGMGVMLVVGIVIVMLGVIVLFVLGMGVVIVVGVMLAGDRLDAVGRHHPDTAELGSVDQPVQPALELQPVDDNDVRFAGRPGHPQGSAGRHACRRRRRRAS